MARGLTIFSRECTIAKVTIFKWTVADVTTGNWTFPDVTTLLHDKVWIAVRKRPEPWKKWAMIWAGKIRIS